MYQEGSLWKNVFQLYELTSIMRQDDTAFSAMLNRVRIEDVQLLHSRTIQESDRTYPHEALHVYRTNDCVNAKNSSMLNKLAHPDRQYTIPAQYTISGQIVGNILILVVLTAFSS